MPIVGTEIKWYRSATVSDAGGNGGRMSTSQITSGAVANLFPTVGESERIAGSTKRRKLFAKNANDADLALAVAKVFMDKYTAGEDRITFIAATQTNTQADLTGSEKEYGVGKLDENVIAGATTIKVLVEDGATQFFDDGDPIRISDKDDVNDTGGTEEFVSVDGAPSVAGDVVTLTITPALASGYSASDTRVANVLEVADVKATISDLDVTSDDGTIDEEQLLGDNIGSVEQTVTGTFTSATAFTLVGDTLGSLGAGSVGAGASPVNGAFGKPYFVLPAAAFGGTFEAGDVFTFDVHASSVPIFAKRVVPAGADAITVNEAVFVLQGETTA